MFGWTKLLFLLALLLLLPFAAALDAPVVSSSTHTEGEWSNSADILFSWDAVDGAIEYCYILSDDAAASPATCIAQTTVTVPKKKDDGTYYFRVYSKAGTETSGTVSYEIMQDLSGPSKPALSGSSLPGGEIKLTWDAVGDTASGVKEYQVYRKLMGNFDIRGTPLHATVSASNLAFTDTNDLSQSTTYHYKIRGVDNAGNVGIASNEVHIVTVAKCDLGISFTAALSQDEDDLLLTIAAENKIYRSSLAADMPDGSSHTFFSGESGFFDWNGSLSLTSVDEGLITLHLVAEEFFGDDCSQDKDFIYDVTDPSVQFLAPRYNEKVSETITFQVEAPDNGDYKSGIADVDLFVQNNQQWQSIGSGGHKEADLYELEWDSFSVENGQQSFKAIVTDRAGNSAETTNALFILNAFGEVVDANTALERAETAREELQETINDLASKAISSSTVQSLLAQADSNLDMAKQLLAGAQPNMTLVKNHAAEAMALYGLAKNAVTVTTFQTGDFIFNKEQVDILLGAAGIGGQAAAEAKQMMEKADPKRQLQIFKVTDDNAAYFKAAILVSFSLDVNLLHDRNAEDIVVQLVEVVPKEFAEYASELGSSLEFNVLADDPTIQFILTKDQYRKKKVSYALKADLSEEQASKLIEDNVVNKFVAPPVLLPPTVSAGGLPLTPGFILFIAIAAVVIVVVILVLVVLKRGGPGSSKGPKGETRPKAETPKPSGGILGKFGKKPKSPLEVFGSK